MAERVNVVQLLAAVGCAAQVLEKSESRKARIALGSMCHCLDVSADGTNKERAARIYERLRGAAL